MLFGSLLLLLLFLLIVNRIRTSCALAPIESALCWLRNASAPAVMRWRHRAFAVAGERVKECVTAARSKHASNDVKMTLFHKQNWWEQFQQKKKKKEKTERDRDRQNEEPSFLGRCFKQQQQQQQQQQNSSEVTRRERALMMYFLSGPRGVERCVQNTW